MISRRRLALAIALLFVCCTLSVIGQARHDVHQRWGAECVALLAGAAAALGAAFALVGRARG